jgi:uncharacterized protein
MFRKSGPQDQPANPAPATKTPGVKIWIDLDNTPHVPFFIPIIRELERRGHQVVLSARDAYQVCELADKKKLPYVKIGHHYGKKLTRKAFGLFWRSAQLVPFYRRHRPVITLAHGSRSLFLVSKLLGLPSIIVMDYEHARSIPLARPRWAILPEALSVYPAISQKKRFLFYRGIKEDVYAPEFEPDPSIREELGLRDDALVITVRPPADQAHYRNPESDILMQELMSRIGRTPGVQAVLLSRNKAQEAAFKADHPEWFADGKVIVPTRVVDGLNLLWFSDLAVSGGGTMNREAAALGVPVYSIFRGTTGAVDLMLEKTGRLTMIHTREEVGTKIRFVRRDKAGAPDHSPRPALEDIVNHIEDIIRIEHVRPVQRT